MAGRARSQPPRLFNCEFQEFLSFCQQSVSQRELIFSRLFSDLRLFVGKSIKVIFPFRAAICQHTVSTIGAGKSTKCGAPGSALFEKSHKFRHFMTALFQSFLSISFNYVTDTIK
jgi:hypothetical protein